MPEPSAEILLVDDEQALLNLMHMYLTRLGYKAEKRETAAEAISAVEAEPQRFKAVVIDITLHDMPGDKAAQEIAVLSPDAKFLLCSGYPFELRSLPAELQPRFGFLQKPFLPKMLAASIEELLGR